MSDDLKKIYNGVRQVRFVGNHYSDPTMQEYEAKPDIHGGDLGDIVYLTPKMMVVAFKPKSWTPNSPKKQVEDLEDEKSIFSGDLRAAHDAMIEYLNRSSEPVAFLYLFPDKHTKWVKKYEGAQGNLEEITENEK